jgi:hypothetical protein
MKRIHILDPTAAPPEVSMDAGADAGNLAGQYVGIRFDQTWRSFLWVLDVWEPVLVARGARIRSWDAGNRVGEAGERTREELGAFAAEVDVAIVGLGN